MADRIVGLIQARMGSVRLPGKAMLPLAGTPIVRHVHDRLLRVPGIEAVVLATTVDPRNEPLVDLARASGMRVFRAEQEDDIAGRLAGAARACGADAVLKVNGDCPLVDPDVLSAIVRRYREEPKADYVSNKIVWTYPEGLSAELIATPALEWCDRNLSEAVDREYVADWIRDHPDRFSVHSVEGERDLRHLRLTVDEPEDLDAVSRIFDALHRDGEVFGLDAILEFLARDGPGPVSARAR